jgi:hypothetical protein
MWHEGEVEMSMMMKSLVDLSSQVTNNLLKRDERGRREIAFSVVYILNYSHRCSALLEKNTKRISFLMTR